MLGTSKLDMGRAVFAMRLPRVPCQSAWRSKQEPLLAGDDMLRIVELSVTCTAHLGGLAAACRGCALLAPAGSGTSSSNSMVQVIAGTWRLLLTAPYKLAVKLVACKQGCVAYLCQPGESCATPAFRRPSPCSAGGGKCAADKVHKAMPEGQRAMPAPPAICCCVQDAEVLELLAANGWDPIHNRQFGKGRGRVYSCHRIRWPFLSCLLWTGSQPLAARRSRVSTSDVLYTLTTCWWSGHTSLPLIISFVHMSAEHLPPPPLVEFSYTTARGCSSACHAHLSAPLP